MDKRLLIPAMLVLLLIAAGAAVLSDDSDAASEGQLGYEFEKDDMLYEVTAPAGGPDPAEVMLLKYKGTAANVTVPQTVLEYTVTSVFLAFEDCTDLVSVSLPSTVTSIGEEFPSDAFMGCVSLKTVTVDPANTHFKNESGCLMQKNGEGWDLVFCPAATDTAVSVAADVGYIDVSILEVCGSLPAVNVDSGNKTYASVSGVLTDKAVSKILFCPRGYAGSFTAPATVNTVGSSAFNSCDGLTSLSLPEVTKIDMYAFRGCTALSGFELPQNLTVIGSHAFEGCSAIVSFNVPDTVTSIGTDAFIGCKAKVQVDAGNTKYCSDATGSLFDKQKTKLLYCPGSFEGAYTIPDTVTMVMDAFSGCTELTSVKVPAGVNSIYRTFRGCTALQFFQVDEANTKYASSDGMLCSKDMKRIFICPAGRSGMLFVPDGTVTIGNEAFSGCSQLTAVTMADSVESLGYGAFMGCTSLETIHVGFGVKTIDAKAFDGCGSIQVISFPVSLVTEMTDINGIPLVKAPGAASVSGFVFGYDTDSVKYLVRGVIVEFVSQGDSRIMEVPYGTKVSGTEVFVTGASNGLKVTAYKGPDYSEVLPSDHQLTAPCKVYITAVPFAVGDEFVLGDYRYSVTALASEGVAGEVRITGYSGAGGKLTLPSEAGVFRVTSVASQAMADSAIVSVHIPASYVKIAPDAFTGNMDLYRYTVDAESTVFSSTDGSLLSKDGTVLLMAPNHVGTYYVPDGVLVFGEHALNGSRAAQLVLSDSVVRMETHAVWKCQSLTDVEFSGSLSEFEPEAICGCDKLRSLAMYSNSDVYLVYQGNLYTRDMSGLVFAASQTTGVHSLPYGVKAVLKGAFACNTLTGVDLPETVTSIAEDAFRDSGLKSVVLHGGITSVASGAFSAPNLNTVYLEPGVSGIADDAFDYPFYDRSGAAEMADPAGSLFTFGISRFICTGTTVEVICGDISVYNPAEFGAKAADLPETVLDWYVSGPYFTDRECTVPLGPDFSVGDVGSTVYMAAVPLGIESEFWYGPWMYLVTADVTGDAKGAVTAVRYSGADTGTLVVPAEVGPYRVTQLGIDQEGIMTPARVITVSQGIEVLDEFLFYENRQLEKVEIPASVTKIRDDVAYCAYSLTEFLVDPESETYTALDGVLFTKDMKTLLVFPQGKQADIYVVPDGVENLYYCAFQCTTIEHVVLPEGLKTIGPDLFAENEVLQSFNVPLSVTDINEFSFPDLYMPDGTKVKSPVGYYFSLQDDVFKVFEVEILLKADGTDIPWYAEYGSKVSDIGNLVFGWKISDGSFYSDEQCTVARDPSFAFTEPGLVSYIKWREAAPGDVFEDGPFSYMVTKAAEEGKPAEIAVIWTGDDVEEITFPSAAGPFKVVSVNSFGCPEAVKRITVSEGIEAIADDAFSGCVQLTSLSLPASLTFIGMDAFYECYELSTVTVAEGSAAFAVKDGVVFSKDMKTLVLCPAALYAEGYAIPDGTEAVAESAFQNGVLKSVVIPGSVQSIGKFAFFECKNLTSIELPANVNVASSVFSHSGLLSVTVGLGCTVDPAAFKEQLLVNGTSAADPSGYVFSRGSSTENFAAVSVMVKLTSGDVFQVRTLDLNAPLNGLQLFSEETWYSEGYYTDAECTVPYGEDYLFAAPVDVYSVHTVRSFTVTFDSAGGSAVADLSVKYGTVPELPAAPVRDGYHFVAWLKQDGTEYVPAPMGAADLALTASWTRALSPSDVEAPGETVSLDVGADTVYLGPEAVDKLAQSGKPLELRFASGAVATLPASAVEKMAKQSGTTLPAALAMTVSGAVPADIISKVGADNAKLLTASTLMVDVSADCKGTVSSLGEVTVQLPYTLKEGESADRMCVLYIASDGSVQKMETSYDQEKNLLTFRTDHFSAFAAVCEEPAPSGGSNMGLIIGAAVAVLAVAGIAVFFVMKRRQ